MNNWRCTFLGIAFMSLTTFCLAQQKKDSLANVGLALYADKEYRQAAEVFDELVREENAAGQDFFNAARMWAMANDADKAFEYLRLAYAHGFLDLKAAEQSEDLRSIRQSERFRRLIAKERAFQADSVISMADVIRALIDRNVVVFENKRFVSDLQPWYDARSVTDKLIEQVDDERLVRTQEGLLDFRSKSLIIRNATGPIHLNGLILKSLEIQNEEDLSANKSKPIPDMDVVQLTRLELASFSFNLYGQAFVRFFSVKATHVENYMLRGIDRFMISDSDLEINTHYRSSIEYELSGSFGTSEAPLKDAIIGNTIFRSNDESSITRLVFNTHVLHVENCTFENEVSFSISAANRTLFPQNRFLKPVDLSKVEFEENGLYMPFDQFENGLGVLDNQRPWEIAKDKLLITGTVEEVKDRQAFGRLVASYKFLSNSYESNGDKESGQQVYLKAKELYLARDRQQFKENPSVTRFIDLQLNRLSGTVSNYGTSAGKVLWVSSLVVLIFSLIYLFFESVFGGSAQNSAEANTSGILKKCTDALMMSLIAQITLQPTKKDVQTGLKWVCLIQGLIGWMLFSFFIIALFSQISI